MWHCGNSRGKSWGQIQGLGEAAQTVSLPRTLSLGTAIPFLLPYLFWHTGESSALSTLICRTQIHLGGPGAARGSRSRAGQVRAVLEQEIPAAPHGRDYGRGQRVWMPRTERLCSQALLPGSAPKCSQTLLPDCSQPHGFSYKKRRMSDQAIRSALCTYFAPGSHQSDHHSPGVVGRSPSPPKDGQKFSFPPKSPFLPQFPAHTNSSRSGKAEDEIHSG